MGWTFGLDYWVAFSVWYIKFAIFIWCCDSGCGISCISFSSGGDGDTWYFWHLLLCWLYMYWLIFVFLEYRSGWLISHQVRSIWWHTAVMSPAILVILRYESSPCSSGSSWAYRQSLIEKVITFRFDIQENYSVTWKNFNCWVLLWIRVGKFPISSSTLYCTWTLHSLV